ncbi:hypothetical protein T8K17_18235 [Thalassobaculum sp. OXR-137]|uniref:hypothetical protein n=1 Tax=Thalassobaculum sp. OXR-137 TaxID=3100173 RepID=UPI002AC956F5|nr:hypothetical protein [Thalassobaculum sp. OXR-137]WPZ33169.1 hypothetical protein T8K17_18235 [Thalassobaculum sp. OXR-137]
MASRFERIFEQKERAEGVRFCPLANSLFYEINLVLNEEVNSEHLDSARKKFAVVQSISAFEIVIRSLIRDLIDLNDEIRLRAVPVFHDVKFNYETVVDIGSNRISLGDIAAYGSNISSVEAGIEKLETLWGFSFDEGLKQVQEHGHISDFDKKSIFKSVRELFSWRHIIVHENPNSISVSLDEVMVHCRECESLSEAVTVISGIYLWKDWGKNQSQMNIEANERYSQITQDIECTISELRGHCTEGTLEWFDKTIAAWYALRDSAAELSAEQARGGSAESHYRSLEGIAMSNQFVESLQRFTQIIVHDR